MYFERQCNTKTKVQRFTVKEHDQTGKPLVKPCYLDRVARVTCVHFHLHLTACIPSFVPHALFHDWVKLGAGNMLMCAEVVNPGSYVCIL